MINGGRSGRLSVEMHQTPPRSRHLEIARHGSLSDRCTLAGSADLDVEVLQILSRDADPMVASSLAINSGVPTSVLQDLLENHPELREFIALNWNAPADLKDEIPLGSHASASLVKYLDDRGATPEQRARLLQMYKASEHPGDPALTLGRAWADASKT